MSEVFNLRRLWLLLCADFVADWRVDAIVCGTLTAVMLIISMIAVLQGGESESFYLSWYFGGLFIWGPIAASFCGRMLCISTSAIFLIVAHLALTYTRCRHRRSRRCSRASCRRRSCSLRSYSSS